MRDSEGAQIKTHCIYSDSAHWTTASAALRPRQLSHSSRAALDRVTGVRAPPREGDYSDTLYILCTLDDCLGGAPAPSASAAQPAQLLRRSCSAASATRAVAAWYYLKGVRGYRAIPRLRRRSRRRRRPAVPPGAAARRGFDSRGRPRVVLEHTRGRPGKPLQVSALAWRLESDWVHLGTLGTQDGERAMMPLPCQVRLRSSYGSGGGAATAEQLHVRRSSYFWSGDGAGAQPRQSSSVQSIYHVS